MKTALTIAGSDCSGGAGIQADLKTMITNDVYGMSVITSLTAQNTLGILEIFDVTPEFLEKQLDSIFLDIFPDAIKIGMVSSKELIEVIVAKLKKYNAKNIIIDPVMISTSGTRLINDEAIDILKNELFPLATLLTPNIPEIEFLTGLKIDSREKMVEGSRIISEYFKCAVLCKGGHSVDNSDDLLYFDGKEKWYLEKRINNPNTHGTGCTLSSAITSNIAKGYSLEESIERAKKYISASLREMLNLGKGIGPLKHYFFDI